MTPLEFVRGFVRVRDERGHLVHFVPTGEQERVLHALTVVDGATGLRVVLTVILSWPRKLGKSTFDAVIGLWMLLFDPFASQREVVILATTKDQGQSAVFRACRRIVKAHPWLAERIKVSGDTMTYTDETGIEHTLRVLPNNPAAVHGLNASCTIFDEAWGHATWEPLEGLSESPARACPLTVWSSYAGLKSQRQPGNPWFDVLTRAQASSDEPAVLLSHISGREQVLAAVPWMTEAWLNRLQRQFEHVPSKFLRLGLNIWSTSESGSFLSSEEIRDATDVSLPTGPLGRVNEASIGVDLGLSHDRTGIIASHVEAVTGRLIVDAVEMFRGTRARPVNLMEVEETIVRIARTLGIRRVTVDRWQAALLVSRLRHRGLWVTERTCDTAWLDRAAVSLKRWFAGRLIRIPARAALLEELEGLESEELRRRDRVRFTASGVNHDDLVVALCLSADPFLGREKHPNEGIIGRPALPEATCLLETSGMGVQNCFLLGGTGIPSDPHCSKHCKMLHAAKTALLDHQQATGEMLDMRTFWRRYPLRPNAFVRARQWHATERALYF